MNSRKTGYAWELSRPSCFDMGLVFSIYSGRSSRIKPYVENSFLLSWLYSIFAVQKVSDLIGIFEIITGVLLLISFWNSKGRKSWRLYGAGYFYYDHKLFINNAGYLENFKGSPL